MKSLLFALVPAVALTALAPAALAASGDPAAAPTEQKVLAHYTGYEHQDPVYTTQPEPAGYWYRGKWHTVYRAPGAARPAPAKRVAAPARAQAPKKKWQLPEYAPKYTTSGKYIPTTYIYQQTNGEFTILSPSPAPAAPGTPAGAAGLRNALQGNNNAAGRPAAPPAPPAAPASAPGRAAPGGPQSR